MDGYVLCGGLSRRMGTDKALLPLRGTVAAVAIARVLEHGGCERVALVSKTGRYSNLGLTVVPDAHHEPHPLWGVAAALRHGLGRLCMVCPTDLHALRPDDVALLLAQPGPCVAFDGERCHPLLAVVPTDWATKAEQMAADARSVRDFARDLPRVVLPAFALANSNSPTEA